MFLFPLKNAARKWLKSIQEDLLLVGVAVVIL